MDPRYVWGALGVLFGGGAGYGYAASNEPEPVVAESGVSTEPAAESEPPPEPPSAEPEAPAALSTETMRVATFNIKVFGKTKAGKTEVMEKLAETVRQYDLVAIQEIKDKDETVPPAFLTELNKGDATWDYVLSPRSGLHESDKTSQEQYAYYFDTAVFDRPAEGALKLYDDTQDHFQREPYLARFVSKSGGFSFVLMNIHTRPESALEEIGALHHVFDWATGQYPGEDDFIALGDYNAGCTYAKPDELDALAIRGSQYTWVVPDDADTNVSTTKACAYDRVVFRNGTTEDYAGEWGVDEVFTDDKFSDHWPVWVKFFTGHDGAGETGEPTAPPPTTCCRTCVTSKACGNACIAADRTCHQPPGCACQG